MATGEVRAFSVELPGPLRVSSEADPETTPPGFSSAAYAYVDPADVASMSRSVDRDAYLSRAWGIARSPMSQLFMWGFYFYMSGSTLGIWSLFVLVPLLSGPIGLIANVHKAFAPVVGQEGVDLTLPKLTYVAFATVGVALGLTKIYQFGLLPISAADWINLLERPHAPHTAAAANGLNGM